MLPMNVSSLSSSRLPRRGAFTLIELLTVIAIIGILAAIIIPTVGKVRETAKTSACASNLRQIAAACLLYANENRNQLVPMKDNATNELWRIKIQPYIGSRRSGQSVLICPGDSITDYPVSSGTGEWPSSYGLNMGAQFTGNPGMLYEYAAGSRSKGLSAIKQPSRMIMVADIGKGTGTGSDPATWTDTRSATSPNYGYARFPWAGGSVDLGDWPAWPRHGGKNRLNAAFFDGHVASLDWRADIQAHPPGDNLCLFDNH
jgi:prepilin-type N-terminal cleavage/methylation domain-containing protein/prepilin-type processing-associated H-X9-DG protein